MVRPVITPITHAGCSPHAPVPVLMTPAERHYGERCQPVKPKPERNG
jgi:hypothetical protein